MTKEFDFFFLPTEVGRFAEIFVPASMIIVCRELADQDSLTLFNMNQALQYGSVGGIYFRSDLSRIPRKRLTRCDGSHFFLIDDLSLPEHLGIFAHRSVPPSLPRVSISLMSRFSDRADVVSPSARVVDVFKSIRAALKSRAFELKANGLGILVSNAASDAVLAGEASTGDAALDKLIVTRKAR